MSTVRYSTPQTFMELLLEVSQFIESSRHNEQASKADLLDSMETRISLLIGKMAAYPTCTSFSVLGGPDPT